MPFYQKGWFQIPRLYLHDAEGGSENISTQSNYCNCIDGNCSVQPGFGFIPEEEEEDEEEFIF